MRRSLAVQALDGWPKLSLQVWSVDEQGNTDIAGYGFVNLPTTPGMYELECPTWVPEGTACARLLAFATLTSLRTTSLTEALLVCMRMQSSVHMRRAVQLGACTKYELALLSAAATNGMGMHTQSCAM